VTAADPPPGMNPWRKALAQHYCPVCDVRLARRHATFTERLALEAGLVVGACALALVLGGTLDRLGLVTGPLAWVTALALLALAGFPIVHIFDRFHCRPCDREFRYGEVRSRGWSLR
jgi:hypothetical protein